MSLVCLVGVVFAFLGLGGGRFVIAPRELVRAVHAGGLHGRRRARQQVGQAAQRGQRAERPERAALAEQLRQRDGGRERAGGLAGRRAAFQIRLL